MKPFDQDEPEKFQVCYMLDGEMQVMEIWGTHKDIDRRIKAIGETGEVSACKHGMSGPPGWMCSNLPAPEGE